MAEIQLPWFMACDHISAGSQLQGDGAFATAVTGNVSTRGGVKVVNLSANTLLDRSIPACASIAVGCRMEHSGGNGNVISLRTGAGAVVASVYVQSSGVLEVRQGAATIGVSAQNVVTMRYVECHLKLAGAGSDAFTLRVDGMDALVLTGLSLGTAPIETIRFGSNTSSGFTYQTHWYIRDATGLENPFYGPILPRWLPVSTDVGAVQWARNGGTSNAGRLRDYPAGTDLATTYVETQTLGHKDEYTVDDLPPDVNSIIAVVPFAVSTAPSGGAPQLRLGVKTSAGETVGPERTVGISGYQTQCGHALTQKPGGGGWSRAAVNELDLTLEAA